MTQGHNFEVPEAVRLAHVPGHAAPEEAINPLNTAEYVPRRAAVEADDQTGVTDAVVELAGSAASHAAVETDDRKKGGSHRRAEEAEPEEAAYVGPFAAGTYGSRAEEAAEQRGEDPFLNRLVSVFDDQEAGAAEPIGQAEEVDDSETEEEGPLVPTVTSEIVEFIRVGMRENFTEPQILARAAEVRRRDEPTYGYWSAYSTAISNEASDGFGAMNREITAAANAKTDEEITDFERYVRGAHGQRGVLPSPDGSGLTEAGYYLESDARALEDLRAGYMPEDFQTVDDLELAIAHMTERGLVEVSNNRRSTTLDNAADLLVEATQRVPGFNPLRAGLDRLYGRSILMVAVLRAESSSWGANRAGRGSSDHMAEMAYHALHASEDTMATLFAQGRSELLQSADEAEEAAAPVDEPSYHN